MKRFPILPRRARRAVAGLGLGALLLGGAGCAQRDLDLGRGGLSAEQDARWSLALAQVRAQAPKGRVSGLEIVPSEAPQGLTEPELALTGEAEAVQRGFQTGQRARLKVALYLDKTSYTRGTLKVTPAGGAEEAWAIVAYQLRGQADREFQFTYLLATPAGALRTLMLVGGPYHEEDEDRLALDGALFLPEPEPRGKAFSPEEWQSAYPFVFFVKEPAQPAYQVLAARSDEVGAQLEQDAAALERGSKRLDALAAEPDAPPAGGPPMPPPQDSAAAALPAPPRTADLRRAELQRQVRELTASLQEQVLHYFELRGDTDTAFAAFLDSNAYRWRDGDGQAEAFTRWEAPDRNAAAVELAIGRFLPYSPSAAAIDQARAAFRATEAKHKNELRRPASRSE